MSFDYEDAPFEVREDIGAAHRRYWDRLAGPGSWWSGAQRVAIAAASREALDCPLCAERAAALSPFDGRTDHVGGGGLPAMAVDAVHRIVNDANRITGRWVEELAETLSKAAYVELVGIVVAVISIDEFHRALGVALEPLPTPLQGEPDGYVPAVLSEDIGFVPTVPAHGAIGAEADLYAEGRAANVLRALTLVPQAQRDWRDLAAAQYLSIRGMANFVKDDARSIDRKQMELVAGRVSAINECFY